MAAPRTRNRRFGMGAAGSTTWYWTGQISPVAPVWQSAVSDAIRSALSGSFSNIGVSVDSADPNSGTSALHISADGSDGGAITQAVVNAGVVNLDPRSVSYSAGDSSLSLSTGAIPFTDIYTPEFQPPVSAIQPGSIMKPPGMQTDYTAPAAPPMPVVALPQKGSVTTGNNTVVRGGTRPLPMESGPGSVTQLPVNVLPPLDYVNPNQNYTPPPIPVVVVPTVPDNFYDPANGILPSDFTGRASNDPVSAGTRVNWTGRISPMANDYWRGVVVDNLSAILGQVFSNVDVSIDPTDSLGTQQVHASVTAGTSYNNLANISDIISAAVQTAGSNLDARSVNYAVGQNAPGVIPVVVTTSTSVPMPTVPIPVVPVTNATDPYYVPAATSPGIGVGVPPISPDPTSVVLPGTPLVTPNLPAPTTTVTTPVVPATQQQSALGGSIEIFGMQIPVIALVLVGGLLVFGGSSSKR